MNEKRTQAGGGDGGVGGKKGGCTQARSRVLCLLAVGSFWLPPVSPSQRTSPNLELPSLEKYIWYIIVESKGSVRDTPGLPGSQLPY